MPDPGLTCCRPYYPAGLAAYHSSFCTFRPNQKLSPIERATWNDRKRARREAETLATTSHHPTSPDAPWFAEHDRLAALGECPDPVCYRCNAVDDSGPYDEQVVV